jgi:hypothetical protein
MTPLPWHCQGERTNSVRALGLKLQGLSGLFILGALTQGFLQVQTCPDVVDILSLPPLGLPFSLPWVKHPHSVPVSQGFNTLFLRPMPVCPPH